MIFHAFTLLIYEVHALIKYVGNRSLGIRLRYSCFPELVSVPYPNQTLKTNFSKNTRQKLKRNIYSYRVSLALTEYNFTFNFCRVFFEKLVSKI